MNKDNIKWGPDLGDKDGVKRKHCFEVAAPGRPHNIPPLGILLALFLLVFPCVFGGIFSWLCLARLKVLLQQWFSKEVGENCKDDQCNNLALHPLPHCRVE